MNRLHEVANALMNLLNDTLPDIPWQERVIGLQIPKELTGSFCCTGIDFKRVDKTTTECVAKYTVYIIDPTVNRVEPRNVETLALQIRDVLTKNNDLDGWAIDSVVDSIAFATAGGRNDVGAAIIEYTIIFDMEE